jgi:hypothetical protein
MNTREIAEILWGWIEEAVRDKNYVRAAELSLDFALINRSARLEN